MVYCWFLLWISYKFDVCMIGKTTILFICMHKPVNSILFLCPRVVKNHQACRQGLWKFVWLDSFPQKHWSKWPFEKIWCYRDWCLIGIKMCKTFDTSQEDTLMSRWSEIVKINKRWLHGRSCLLKNLNQPINLKFNQTYLRKITKTLNEIGNFKCFRNTSAIGFSTMKNKECIFGIE